MGQSTAGIGVEIYSDVICPWCYVGKRRLERALARLRGTVTAQSMWRPFQLNPTMPPGGMDRAEYLKAKFGSLDAFRTMESQLLSAGEGERISFAFGKIVRTPNTFSAHRLIWYAGLHGRQDAVVEALFKAYFEDGVDIGSVRILIHLAERNGLKAEAFLRGDEGTAEVKAEEAEGRKLGIHSVPYFVLNQAYGISGAQPADIFTSAIEKVQARRVVAGQSTSGR